MNKKDKMLINQSLLYPKNPLYWGRSSIETYLRQLKERGLSDIHTSANAEMLKNRIFDWIKNGDPDLSLFWNTQKQIERTRRQINQPLNLPKDVLEEIKKVVAEKDEIEYNPHDAGTFDNPKIVHLKKTGERIEVWVAYNIKKKEHETAFWEKLEEPIQEYLASLIEKNQKEYVKFESILLQYLSTGRIVTIINMNLEEGTLNITTNEKKYIDPDDEKSKEIHPQEKFKTLLFSTFELLKIPFTKQQIEEMTERKRISKESVSQIKSQEEKDFLLLTYKFVYQKDNGNISEKATNDFIQLKEKTVVPKVSSYYDAHGTFENFFHENPDLDGENNGIFVKSLKNIEESKTTSVGFYIFIINDDKKLLFAQIICNMANGTMNITYNKEQTGEECERISRELDKIFP